MAVITDFPDTGRTMLDATLRTRELNQAAQRGFEQSMLATAQLGQQLEAMHSDDRLGWAKLDQQDRHFGQGHRELIRQFDDTMGHKRNLLTESNRASRAAETLQGKGLDINQQQADTDSYRSWIQNRTRLHNERQDALGNVDRVLENLTMLEGALKTSHAQENMMRVMRGEMDTSSFSPEDAAVMANFMHLGNEYARSMSVLHPGMDQEQIFNTMSGMLGASQSGQQDDMSQRVRPYAESGLARFDSFRIESGESDLASINNERMTGGSRQGEIRDYMTFFSNAFQNNAELPAMDNMINEFESLDMSELTPRQLERFEQGIDAQMRSRQGSSGLSFIRRIGRGSGARRERNLDETAEATAEVLDRAMNTHFQAQATMAAQAQGQTYEEFVSDEGNFGRIAEMRDTARRRIMPRELQQGRRLEQNLDVLESAGQQGVNTMQFREVFAGMGLDFKAISTISDARKMLDDNNIQFLRPADRERTAARLVSLADTFGQPMQME